MRRVMAIVSAVALGLLLTTHTVNADSATTSSNSQSPYVFGPGTWEDIGGVLASSPTVATSGSGILDAFVRGTDNQIWHLNTSTNSWDRASGLIANSDVSPVATGPGTYAIFASGADRALYYNAFDGSSWAGWLRLGGSLAGTPSAVSTGTNMFEVFVRQTDNRLWRLTLNTSTTPATFSWHFIGGVLAAPPSAVYAGGQVNVFVMGTDLQLWRWILLPGGPPNAWFAYGGRLAAQPAVNQNTSGGLDVFVEGTDTALWHWSNNSPIPNGFVWELVGGRLGSPPSATAMFSGRLDVAVRGTDGALWHAWGTGNGWTWEGLGGVLAGPPAAVGCCGNRLDILVRGGDHHLWHLPFA